MLNRLKLSFPITLLFSSISNKYVISALGFAEIPDAGALPTPARYTEPGSCGGCFTLDDGTGALSVGVIDAGKDIKKGYAFKLWLQNPDTGEELPHDPRIYNRGQVGT